MVLNEYMSRILSLIKAAGVLEAKQNLELINIISVPHLKKVDARKIIDAYSKILRGDEKVDSEQIKKERAALLKRLRGQSF